MNDVGNVYDDDRGLEAITCQSDLEPTMKRWQELEPERCLFHEKDRIWLVYDQEEWQGLGRYYESPKLFGMVAAAAARSSLLSRSWPYITGMGWEGNSAFVFVKVTDAQGKHLACNTGLTTSFDELTVQSYVAALGKTVTARAEPVPQPQIYVWWMHVGFESDPF